SCPSAGSSPTGCSTSCAAATSCCCSARATCTAPPTSCSRCSGSARRCRRYTERMMPAALTTTLGAALAGRVHAAEPLARHTSFRIGGPADALVAPDTAEELALVVRTATAHGVPVTILGNGSNLLVGDGGIRGVVVKLGRGFRRVGWSRSGGA